MKEKYPQATNNNVRKVLSGKSFAYKAIFLADGVAFLFEELKPFTEDDVKINVYNGNLFLELGSNVALTTEKILKHLIRTKHLFLYKSPFSAYEAEEETISFEGKPEILARIHGAWEVAKMTPNGIEH